VDVDARLWVSRGSRADPRLRFVFKTLNTTGAAPSLKTASTKRRAHRAPHPRCGAFGIMDGLKQQSASFVGRVCIIMRQPIGACGPR
jgi:hypothetical protein